ncbi:MAG: stage II sporulation protein D [Oscillospiraceae bacterium]|nr:stage II sporulation protein D [Oscillospiraceae bacterium]
MKELLKNAATILIMLALIPLAAFLFAENDAGYFSVYDKSDSGAKKLTEREYLVGALASEMPPTFHIEALKAQAAAIYTNAFRLRAAGEKYAAEIDSEKNEGYIDDKTLRERWGKSYEVYIAKMQKAVDSVLGCVVAYDGRPIVAAYHSISSGKTESAENVWGGQVPYLAAVDSSGDTYNANLESIKSISASEARKALASAFPDAFLPQDDSLLFTDFEYSPSGTVLSCTVGNIEVSGQKIRELFSLRSACFTVSYKDEGFAFSVKGYGHGVGLSQYGADFMARQGSGFEEILKHYYTGVVLMQAKQ